MLSEGVETLVGMASRDIITPNVGVDHPDWLHHYQVSQIEPDFYLRR
jgi:hypothetical protein